MSARIHSAAHARPTASTRFIRGPSIKLIEKTGELINTRIEHANTDGCQCQMNQLGNWPGLEIEPDVDDGIGGYDKVAVDQAAEAALAGIRHTVALEQVIDGDDLGLDEAAGKV